MEFSQVDKRNVYLAYMYLCKYNSILYIQINLLFEVWDYSISEAITNIKMSDLVLLSSGQVI